MCARTNISLTPRLKVDRKNSHDERSCAYPSVSDRPFSKLFSRWAHGQASDGTMIYFILFVFIYGGTLNAVA